jgi:lysyl-tRNA synthetase class 2
MKRLLVGGLEKIFQITPAFRAEPLSTTHHPEFTLLEWYRAYATDEDLRRDTENLVAFLATKLFGEPKIRFQGKEISVRSPWPRLAVRDLFLEKAGVDLVKASSRDALGSECKRLGLKPNAEDTWDDLYFRIWLNEIEPQLPADQAVFVTRYPASQAALAVLDQDPDGTTWAKRFEVYAGGLELGNAFEELTNPDEQEKRFNKDMELRKETYGEDFPACPKEGVDDFLQALREGMPPSAGIAVGVDRLVMLLADEPEIDYTVWLRPSVETASSERS